MDGKIATLAVRRVGIRTTGYDALEVVAPQALPLGYEGDDRPWLRQMWEQGLFATCCRFAR